MSSGTFIWIDNERVKTDVYLHKVDASHTTRPVRGASFKLYYDSLDGKHDNGDGVFDPKDDALVSEGTTDEQGTVSFAQLTVGTYFLVETNTPAGYQINDEVFRIQVFDVAGQAGGAAGNMIQVGKADGSDMRAPDTPNTITVADKPIPSIPSTGGPGVVGLVAAGGCLSATGAGALLGVLGRRRRRR